MRGVRRTRIAAGDEPRWCSRAFGGRACILDGELYQRRTVSVVIPTAPGAADGVELSEEQLAGLCNGGALP